MAGARALWIADGMKRSQFGKPVIAIANSFTQFVPGHTHLHEAGQIVKAEIEKLGCFAAEFNTIAVDDGIAALELTEFPYGAVPRSEVTAKGKTSPGASVTVTIDDGEPREAAVEADGAFSYTLPVGEVEDWVDHTIAIAAHEEGLEDCTARFTFSTEYDEASQGIAAYRKTLSGGVTGWNVNKDPAAHVGERMALEVRTLTVDRRDGILSVECCIDSDESRPVILVYPNYMDDEIAPFMVITVYGEIVEPAQMDPPVPRMEVEYTQNLIIEYIRWRY